MIWMKLITIILLYGKAKGRWLSNKQFYLELWDEQYCFARLLQHSANILVKTSLYLLSPYIIILIKNLLNHWPGLLFFINNNMFRITFIINVNKFHIFGQWMLSLIPCMWMQDLINDTIVYNFKALRTTLQNAIFPLEAMRVTVLVEYTWLNPCVFELGYQVNCPSQAKV